MLNACTSWACFFPDMWRFFNRSTKLKAIQKYLRLSVVANSYSMICVYWHFQLIIIITKRWLGFDIRFRIFPLFHLRNLNDLFVLHRFLALKDPWIVFQSWNMWFLTVIKQFYIIFGFTFFYQDINNDLQLICALNLGIGNSIQYSTMRLQLFSMLIHK